MLHDNGATAFSSANIGHNGGPPLDPGADWRAFCWRKAHARAWRTPPREICACPPEPSPGSRHDLPRIHLSAVGSRDPSLREAPPVRGLAPNREVSASLRQVLGDEVPVDQVVQEGLDEVRPAVLIVEVVSVLPHIAGQQRRLAFGQRIEGVRCGGDLELSAVADEPPPTAGELADRRRPEQLLALVEAAA